MSTSGKPKVFISYTWLDKKEASTAGRSAFRTNEPSSFLSGFAKPDLIHD